MYAVAGLNSSTVSGAALRRSRRHGCVTLSARGECLGDESRSLHLLDERVHERESGVARLRDADSLLDDHEPARQYAQSGVRGGISDDRLFHAGGDLEMVA